MLPVVRPASRPPRRARIAEGNRSSIRAAPLKDRVPCVAAARVRTVRFEPRRENVICGAASEPTAETSEDCRRQPQLNPGVRRCPILMTCPSENPIRPEAPGTPSVKRPTSPPPRPRRIAEGDRRSIRAAPLGFGSYPHRNEFSHGQEKGLGRDWGESIVPTPEEIRLFTAVRPLAEWLSS